MKRHWDEFTTYDFARLNRANLVAILPLAATEQHGPHLPLSTDRIILEGLIAAALPHLPDGVPAAFLPVQSVARSEAHVRYPGTLALSAGTLQRILVEIGGSVAASGVRRLIVLNGHAGNAPVAELAVRELRIAHDIVAVAADALGLGVPEGIVAAEERRHGLHGGEVETALMLALRPDLVATDRARSFESLSERLERNFSHLGIGGAARLGWQAQDLNPAGAVGNAAAATAETGRALLDHGGRAIAALIGDVHRLPVSLLHNPTEM